MMQEKQYTHSGKKYIDVIAVFHSDGRLVPVSIIWEDGRRFEIDRILDIRKAASLKAGGIGTRYICMICGKQIALYFEEPRWFIEI